jgi:hypothetical protein
MRAKELLTGLALEQPRAVAHGSPDELPQLGEPAVAVRRSNAHAAGPDDPRELGEREVDRRHVIEHEVRHRNVELAAFWPGVTPS